LYSY